MRNSHALLTKGIMAVLSVTLVTTAVFAGSESLRECSQPRNGIAPDSMPWLPGVAQQNACDQTIIYDALQVTSAVDSPNKVIAFHFGKLVGVRDSTLRVSTPVLFEPSAWQEFSSTPLVGELWWGRMANRQVFVGQESFSRLGKGPATRSPREVEHCLAESKRLLQAWKNKQPAPPPVPFADDSGLFPRRSLEYAQIGSTAAIFVGGLGGLRGDSGPIPPGQITQAKLSLETLPHLTGTLSFNLEADGVRRNFTFPVMRNVSKANNRSCLPYEEKFRLRGAAVVNGVHYRCSERPNASKPYATKTCEFSEEPFQEDYEAYGAFFGDHALLAAIQVRITLNVPSRHRHGVVATGIIILQEK